MDDEAEEHPPPCPRHYAEHLECECDLIDLDNLAAKLAEEDG